MIAVLISSLALMVSAPLAASSEMTTDKLHVATKPVPALVCRNGISHGRTPLAVPVPRIGEVTLTLQAPGYKPYTLVVNNDDGGTSRVIRMRKSAGTPSAKAPRCASLKGAS